MIVDRTSKNTSVYTYKLLQLHSDTREVFNVGIIMQASDGKIYEFFAEIQNKANCINIEEYQDIAFLLQKFQDHMKEPFFNENSYSHLSLTKEYIFTTEKNAPKEALSELIDTFISVKSFIKKVSSPLKVYDKRTIHRSIREYIKTNKIKNVEVSKHFDIARKAIDIALVDDDKPYSIATITSPHVEKFYDEFSIDIMTLQESQRKGKIQKAFLHTPVFENITTRELNKKLGWAKEQAQHFKYDILTDPREEAVLEMLETHST